uniref:Reverse transcriptase domain-containing protein n=1 Tax=Cannabis sativa TaxID=3483 RepID=A0A803P4G4_CANSA
MNCVRNTSYSLLMNGRVQGSFKGEQGLRQGDPISPLLFVLVMEYLSRSIQKATRDKDFSVIKEIEKLCHGFFWGLKDNRSRVHLISWERVCLPKAYGGLGFKDGTKWNKASLARFIWDLMNKKDLLWVKWINSIYLKGSDFWSYRMSMDTSWYWRKRCRLRITFNKAEIVAAGGEKFKTSSIYCSMLKQNEFPAAGAICGWARLDGPRTMIGGEFGLAVQGRLRWTG